MRSLLASLAFCTVSMVGLSAKAETLYFDFASGSPGGPIEAATWFQSSNPVAGPSSIYPLTGFSVNVTNGNFYEIFTVGGTPHTGTFNHIDYTGGGFDVGNSVNVNPLGGGAFFSFSNGNPVFSPGVYIFGTLTVTAFSSGVPEPATWTVMLAGFGGLGAAVRARRRWDRRREIASV